MNDTKICVVSYKRPYNTTCKLLMKTNIENWFVYVYSFDPFFEEYKNNYGEHVRAITEFDKASLPKKRQLVLDDAIKEGYKYCIMMDDDIFIMKNLYTGNDLTIDVLINQLWQYAHANTEYVALSACYNQSEELLPIVDCKNICNNSIFNLELLKSSDITYNVDSRCEDMEFTIELLLKGYKTGRLDYILAKNQLQGGTTNDGLSYRFSGKNRFIEEGEYMSSRYPQLKDVFEFDKNHFKMNTTKLKEILQKTVYKEEQ